MTAQNQESLNYKSAGVDIEAGNELVERIKPIAAKTPAVRVLAAIGLMRSTNSLPAAISTPALL